MIINLFSDVISWAKIKGKCSSSAEEEWSIWCAKSFSAHNSIHHVFHRFEFFISIEVTTFFFSLRKLILDRGKLLLI